VDAALDIPDYEAFCELIEKRENVDKLAARIEELEDERLRRADRKEPAPPADEPAAHGPQADPLHPGDRLRLNHDEGDPH
jgi:hypothetical protein